MKDLYVRVTYSVTMSILIPIPRDNANTEIEALEYAANTAPVPNNDNLSEFQVDDFEQFELTDEDFTNDSGTSIDFESDE